MYRIYSTIAGAIAGFLVGTVLWWWWERVPIDAWAEGE
jgi:hypothetical protein